MNKDTKRFACERFAEVIAYRRSRRWQVFSWASGILIALMGGVVALIVTTGNPLLLTHQVALSFAATLVTICAAEWIRRGVTSQLAAQSALNRYYESLRIDLLPESKKYAVGPRLILLLLLCGALLTIWISGDLQYLANVQNAP